jgi:hypothetical protein
MLKAFFNGAILLNCWAVSLFFYRFWRRTHDPLFGFFAAAFSLLGAERLGMFFFSELQPLVYCIRLAAFLLIIYAIINKNRRGGTGTRPDPSRAKGKIQTSR